MNVKAADVSTIFNRAPVQLFKIAKFSLFYIHTVYSLSTHPCMWYLKKPEVLALVSESNEVK